MKTTSLAVLLSVFVLCSVVSAQDYQIRTDANVNLRATFSLDGNIVETVPSGTILQVIGRFNRWLKIDRNGNALWLADWVPYTRVTDSDQTQSQIDNCCFVDRQCHSDAEWTDGYWAFQNNQCGAPLQTQLQIPLQSTGNGQSDVNNCCFIGWQCHTDEDWGKGYFAFQIDHCDVPAGLIIEGSEDFVSLIKVVLRLLQNRAPEWYAYATSGLDKIREDPEANYSGVNPNTRIWRMPPSRALAIPDRESSLISLAGAMVHEACHVHNWEAGLRFDEGWENELPCVQRQLEVTEAIDPHDRFSPGLRDIIANIENPEYWWWVRD